MEELNIIIKIYFKVKEDKKINRIFYSNKNDYFLYNNIENDEIFEIIFKRKKQKNFL